MQKRSVKTTIIVLLLASIITLPIASAFIGIDITQEVVSETESDITMVYDLEQTFASAAEFMRAFAGGAGGLSEAEIDAQIAAAEQQFLQNLSTACDTITDNADFENSIPEATVTLLECEVDEFVITFEFIYETETPQYTTDADGTITFMNPFYSELSNLNGVAGQTGPDTPSFDLENEEILTMLQEAGFAFSYTLIMPGTIQSTTIGTASGDTVTISLEELVATDTTDLVVTSQATQASTLFTEDTTLTWLLGVGILLLLALILIIILTKSNVHPLIGVLILILLVGGGLFGIYYYIQSGI